MQIQLDEREHQVLECLLTSWEADERKLPGRLCYQDVFDLMNKLGVDSTNAELRLTEKFQEFSKYL